MGIRRTVEPASLAVDLDQAKKQCEVSTSDTSHDEHLTRLIKTATANVERYTRRALINQTWKLSLCEWPCHGRVYLPRPPLVSISSIQYVAESGTLTSLNSSLYQVADDRKPAFVAPAYGLTWPVVRSETVEPIEITYVAGYGANHSSIPDEFKNVIYELVAFRFMFRGDVDTDIPKHIRWSLDSLKCGAAYNFYGLD